MLSGARLNSEFSTAWRASPQKPIGNLGIDRCYKEIVFMGSVEGGFYRSNSE